MELKQLRRDKGLTQKELGDRCGVSQAQISKIERGVITPSMAVLERIANAVDAGIIADAIITTKTDGECTVYKRYKLK